MLRSSRRRRWLVLLTGLALSLSLVAACAVANLLVVTHAHARIFTAPDHVPTRTVAIVPGARVYPDGTPSPMLRDRLEAARTLYARGRVRRILVSGDHGRVDYDEVNAMRRWLVEHGVPDDDVFLDHAGFRTFDTMVRASRVFQVRDAVVCTQRFHLARSLVLAEGEGIDAVGFVADRSRYPSRRVDATREFFARSFALIDRYVRPRGARYRGPAIPIDGDARASRDD